MVIYQNMKLVTGGQIIEGMEVVCEGETILAVTPARPHTEPVTDLQGKYLAPGFIDLHCHGAWL